MTAKVITRFEFLYLAVPLDGYQYFVIGMDDADGPMLTLTTHLPSGFYFDSRWWWQPDEDTCGIRLVLLVQSLTSGLECYTWRPAIRHPALNQFVLSNTTDRVLYGEECFFGTLAMRELELPEFETFRWFDGGTTPHFYFGWQRPQDRDSQWPIIEGEQVAP